MNEIQSIDKSDLIKNYQIHSSDTGSSFVQVAILSQQIKDLSTHLSNFKKDQSARYSLLNKIAKRLKLLKYLHKYSYAEYQSLIEKLGIKDKFI